MRYSRMLIPTLKEVPADAQVQSHILMLRAGMIRKLAAGIYTYLPLALRSIRKVETIVREELNRSGAQELLMPMVQPSEIWESSGRWNQYGPELLRIKDRKGGEFCLGPTHEEVITHLFSNEIKSYRQLPINLYQIMDKFRDEIRPRFGLMRGREFIMKDAYSFHINKEDALESGYKVMYDAYTRIFTRCGLKFRAVEADTGAIGGNYSHEFQVLASSGEDTILACDACEYSANVEKAESKYEMTGEVEPGSAEVVEVHTPNQRTIDEISAFLKVGPEKLIKTLIYHDDDGKFYAICLRGDEELNELKLKNHLGVNAVYAAEEADILKQTGAPVGFAGPVGMKLPVICDFSVKTVADGVTGANKKDYHFTGVNRGRDFEPIAWADLRCAKDGEGCPRCDGGILHEYKGIEVGQTFYLGKKYSSKMKAVVQDENGKDVAVEMGCYGIGVSRTVASAIEQNHDDKGIIWPLPIAPFAVEILPVMMKDDAVREAGEKLYGELLELGIEVLLDDRTERPGIKFNDADLLGIPIRITIGKKSLKDGNVEFKLRRSQDVELIPLTDIVTKVQDTIAALMAECSGE